MTQNNTGNIQLSLVWYLCRT